MLWFGCSTETKEARTLLVGRRPLASASRVPGDLPRGSEEGVEEVSAPPFLFSKRERRFLTAELERCSDMAGRFVWSMDVPIVCTVSPVLYSSSSSHAPVTDNTKPSQRGSRPQTNVRQAGYAGVPWPSNERFRPRFYPESHPHSHIRKQRITYNLSSSFAALFTGACSPAGAAGHGMRAGRDDSPSCVGGERVV